LRFIINYKSNGAFYIFIFFSGGMDYYFLSGKLPMYGFRWFDVYLVQAIVEMSELKLITDLRSITGTTSST